MRNWLSIRGVLDSLAAAVIFVIASWIIGDGAGRVVPLWLVVCVVVALGLMSWWRERRYVVETRSERVYRHNLRLLQNSAKLMERQIIRVSRFCDWLARQERDTTKSFRAALTALAGIGTHEIRQLWIVRDGRDVDRLKDVMRMYGGMDRVFFRCLVVPSCPSIPEILIVGNTIGTIAIPGDQSVYLTSVTEFRSRPAVESLVEYYDTLYGASVEVMSGGRVDTSALEKISCAVQTK